MPLIQLSFPQKVSMGNEWFELSDPGHFWVQWRFSVLQRFIEPHLGPSSRILEIGCGNGLIMWQMEHVLKLISDGCDLNAAALKDMLPVSGQVFLYDIFDFNPLLTGQYDLVMMLDVLEHIEDDRSFLQAALQYLRPGGWLVTSVPAHPGLFSVYDRHVGHVRRYVKQDFSRLLSEAGLQNIQVSYWGMAMLPMLWLRKWMMKFVQNDKVIQAGFKPPHTLFNRFMLMLMHAETRLIRNTPSGISLMAAGQKIS